MSKLSIIKDNRITDVSSWFKYAQPEGGATQWKDGRSAKEFARYMTAFNGELPKALQLYLQDIGINDSDFECRPEHVTSFAGYDIGTGEGRHHDALIISSSTVIGIEAKVSEPFDKSVKEKLEKASKNSDGGKNMKSRIFGSLKIFHPTYSEEDVYDIMYQLISATTGTIIETYKLGKRKGVVLIIEFAGDVNIGNSEAQIKKEKQQIIENDNAYIKFLKFLDLDKKSDKERYLDTNFHGKDMRIWFKKLRININESRLNYSVE